LHDRRNQVTNENAGAEGGGGINSGLASTLTVSGSTIANNTVGGSTVGSGGGGIQTWSSSAATVTIVNSTISGNTSSVDGGGIENLASYSMTLTNVTLNGNSANASSGRGGNVNNVAVIAFENTIVAYGSASSGADIENDSPAWTTRTAEISSRHYRSVAGNGAFGALPLGATPDLSAEPPLLGALANNGGPTQTMADTASSPGRLHPVHQRWLRRQRRAQCRPTRYTRGAGGVCDIGAYEFSGTP